MRTILERHGYEDVEKLDFTPLALACFSELALSSSETPATKAEALVRKIASRAKDILIAINELRNEAGTGHGKASGKARPIDQADAEMIAAVGMILAAWLMRRDPLG
ncbi:abortive infection family protein [Bradyrhizobium sp. RT7b]|uniref:abortive infection family protein n=1 Tax=unclassified Bradyrhizobium TaxID=2631580 RepID=UPI00339575EE